MHKTVILSHNIANPNTIQPKSEITLRSQETNAFPEVNPTMKSEMKKPKSKTATTDEATISEEKATAKEEETLKNRP